MGASQQLELADRLANLGSETAFAVSKAAAEWASAGNEVFPFHLGDIDLATPRNIVEAMRDAIDAGHTGYCAGAGIDPLRAALADDIGTARGLQFSPEHIAVQPGGKPVITKFIQTLMNRGDGVLFPNPGYPIYESQVEYFGGTPLPYGYSMTATGFEIDMARIEEQAPNARLLIYNNLQNPLGCESSREEMERIAELAVKHNLWVLSDEAYFEMRYSGSSTSIASLPGMSERTVILYTFSKRFAMTGWRLGCAAGPTPVIEAIARLNTNDESCTTHFIQHAGIAALRDPSGSIALLEELRRRRDATARGLAPMYPASSLPFLKQPFISSPGWQRQWTVSATQMLASLRPQRSTKQECRFARGITSADHSHVKMTDLFGSRTPASVKSASSADFNDLPSGSIKERNDCPTHCRHRKNS